MKKILFLHGFYASGQCVPALALREAFAGRAEVLTPDLPMHPNDALQFIRELIECEHPDILVGNSCGAFYAQMLAPVVGIPALLGNPHFRMSDFLRQRIGQHQYKSPRKDGKQSFVIDEALVEEFAVLEATQFDNCTDEYRERVWGLFGEQDTLAHFEPLFLEHYNRSFHFPGGHTPTADEVHNWYVPMVELQQVLGAQIQGFSVGQAITAHRTIRLAEPSDMQSIMQVMDAAKQIMRASGNLHQWVNGYPSEAVIGADMEKHVGYVIEENGRIIAYFAFISSPDPTYAKIYEGQWLDEEMPYHVIHRIGSYPNVHHVFDDIMEYCFSHDPNIRIDTHRENTIMQHNILKHGFTYCGIIYLASGDERLAYQKIIRDE